MWVSRMIVLNVSPTFKEGKYSCYTHWQELIERFVAKLAYEQLAQAREDPSNKAALDEDQDVVKLKFINITLSGNPVWLYSGRLRVNDR